MPKTGTIAVGSKVKVQIGKQWKPGRVAELSHEGVVARVELDTKDEHKSVYARTDALRPIS
jgi:hypothetical protein